jgi:hypothetical protein
VSRDNRAYCVKETLAVYGLFGPNNLPEEAEVWRLHRNRALELSELAPYEYSSDSDSAYGSDDSRSEEQTESI